MKPLGLSGRVVAAAALSVGVTVGPTAAGATNYSASECVVVGDGSSHVWYNETGRLYNASAAESITVVCPAGSEAQRPPSSWKVTVRACHPDVPVVCTAVALGADGTELASTAPVAGAQPNEENLTLEISSSVAFAGLTDAENIYILRCTLPERRDSDAMMSYLASYSTSK